MRPALSSCRSCSAEILWVETAAGKRMPVDREPAKRVVLLVAAISAEKEGDLLVLRPPRIVSGPEALEPDSERARAHVVDTFMPHHATCPDGPAWKKKGKP